GGGVGEADRGEMAVRQPGAAPPGRPARPELAGRPAGPGPRPCLTGPGTLGYGPAQLGLRACSVGGAPCSVWGLAPGTLGFGLPSGASPKPPIRAGHFGGARWSLWGGASAPR